MSPPSPSAQQTNTSFPSESAPVSISKSRKRRYRHVSGEESPNSNVTPETSQRRTTDVETSPTSSSSASSKQLLMEKLRAIRDSRAASPSPSPIVPIQRSSQKSKPSNPPGVVVPTQAQERENSSAGDSQPQKEYKEPEKLQDDNN